MSSAQRVLNTASNSFETEGSDDVQQHERFEKTRRLLVVSDPDSAILHALRLRANRSLLPLVCYPAHWSAAKWEIMTSP